MSKLPETSDDAMTLQDAWDFKGLPALRSATGGWASSAMILGIEATERLTTLGIAVNLVTYLTGTMHLGSASSANTVTNFLGTSFMLCLFGGFIADTFLGRYRTIAIFATIQALGVTILTISTIIPSLRPPKCDRGSSSCVPASGTQLLVLYIALYLTALGTGGLKSSVSGLGSDQFDETDKKEKNQMIKFFSWFFFFISIGSLCAVSVLVYIQDEVGRKYGYGICACAIVAALFVFLSGTKRYRFKKLLGSPLTQIASVFVAAWKKRRMDLPSNSSMLFDVDDIVIANPKKMKMKPKLPHSKQYRFLDKASIKDFEDKSNGDIVVNKWKLSTLTDVEEVKMVIRMLPIWATSIMFWTVHAQMTTFSVTQSETMNRKVGNSFEIPPAAMNIFFIGTTLLTVPIYDRIVVPLCKRHLKNPYGLTPLQRIGTGQFFGTLAMASAALVEIKRLHVARSNGLTNDETTMVPISVFYLIPQFMLTGAGEAFTYIGQLDFFLTECPKGMKTMSTGLFLSTLSLGFFFSSILVTIVHKLTTQKPWLADNLNQGKLYDFYWLVAAICVLNFVAFQVCARWYVYKEKRFADEGIEMEEDVNEEPNFH